MTQPSKEAIALGEWREANWHELDASMQALVEVRDAEGTQTVRCPYCRKTHVIQGTSPRDRIEAVKGITRLLGAMSTRPADAMKPKTDPAKQTAKNTMSPEEAAEVEGILGLRRYAANRPTDT